MAIKYLYKCNPKVAQAAGVTAFDRFTWPDGSFLLWENDLIAIDRDRFFLDRDGFLADLGIVRMTDPQAAEEQRNPQIILPEARLPEFRWASGSGELVAESGESGEDSDDSESDNGSGPDEDAETETDTEPAEGAEE